MIRRLEPGDCGQLSAIHAQCFETGWNVAAFQTLMAQPHTVFYGWDSGGDIACFAGFSVVAGEAEILTLATAPAYRRQGLARPLLNQAIFSLAAETVFLEVAIDNGPAIALYDGLGFERTGLRKAYYARRDGPAVDALILRLALPRANF